MLIILKLVIVVGAFVAGILVGRRNKSTVEAVVGDAKNVAKKF